MTAPNLARKAFTTSRLAEFASGSELIRQTGQPAGNWPLVIVKELVDNALDAAEEAGTAPVVEVIVDGDSITVTDHGPGIAPGTVASLLDYTSRTSSRAALVSPTRGAQGNALQTILAMPFALDGKRGEVLIESQSAAHRIAFTVDPVRQIPIIDRATGPSAVKIGARVTVNWPEQASSLIEDAGDGFLPLVATYGWLNPHLDILVKALGESRSRQATNSGWTKWTPSQPTSPHWYDSERLTRLMAAEIAYAEDHEIPCPSVRDLIRQFRGLKGTAKANDICEALSVAERTSLADYYAEGSAAVLRLLLLMGSRSAPVKPRDLGIVGRDHLMARFAEDGCDPDSFVYRKVETDHLSLPYVIEVAFGYRDDEGGRRIVEGFNFTPAIGGSPFRLDRYLENARIEEDDPVTVFAHLTSPRLDFLDRGKSRVALPYTIEEQLAAALTSVTKAWTRQKTAEIRDAQAMMRRYDAMVRRDRPMSIKEAAYAVMRNAYLKASANGALPAKPRQIMYAARPQILEMTGRSSFDSDYFSQTVLVDYIKEHPDETKDWDIIWDDRGHFAEPHSGVEIGLGTQPVRDYIAGFHAPEIVPVGVADAHVSMAGPEGQYGAVLFVEKEGFEQIFQAAGLYRRYDLAPMSSKGMSTTAGRTLVEELCGRRGLPLFVLHDFDVAGFSIHQTLSNDTERYQFEHEIDNVIEIGLRLTDVERLDLASEPVAIGDAKIPAIENRLRINDATEEEIEFLLGDEPRRVELNSMASDQLVALVEGALEAHGVGKVVPPAEMLADAYTAIKRGAMAKAALEAELERLNAEPVDVLDDLDDRVREKLEAFPTGTWDDAVRAIVEEAAS